MAKVGAKKKRDIDKKIQVAFYTEKFKVEKLGGMEKVRETTRKHIDEIFSTKK